ncbi:MAG: hypothetical protein LBD57_04685 [Endomicrobium sp.]|jgi:hypothetical protein|uniref:hypothetical protein n=1 Tax=Candidatus Endomicrobiellum cubanum TaxID=3242325 RepID=UPI00282ADC24|nr:hypothetical protein [Endomicrobium sp.]
MLVSSFKKGFFVVDNSGIKQNLIRDISSNIYNFLHFLLVKNAFLNYNLYENKIFCFNLLLIYMLSACSSKEAVKSLVEDRLSNASHVSNTDVNTSQLTTIDINSSLAQELRSRGFQEWEVLEMLYIAQETYDGEPGCIGGGTYITRSSKYAPVEFKCYKCAAWSTPGGGVGGDVESEIFSIRRLLNHLGQCGLVDRDLWKRYTYQEIMEIVHNDLGSSEYTISSFYSGTAPDLIDKLISNITISQCHKQTFIFFYEGTPMDPITY